MLMFCFFSKVPVIGITSLGLDHTFLLGDTIDKIAWQKSGIMKSGAVAFTAAEQPLLALQVLKQRAEEKNVGNFKIYIFKFTVNFHSYL